MTKPSYTLPVDNNTTTREDHEQAVQGVVDALHEDVETRALQVDLDTLSEDVGTRALQVDLDTLSEDVGTRALQVDLDTLSEDVGTRALQVDLDTLSEDVGTRALQVDLDTLSEDVGPVLPLGEQANVTDHPQFGAIFKDAEGTVLAGMQRDGTFRMASLGVGNVARMVSAEHPEFVQYTATASGVVLSGLTHDGQLLPGGESASGETTHIVSHVYVEPWEDPSENLTITWISNSADATTVEYRLPDATTWQAAQSFRTRAFPALENTYLHTALLPNLSWGAAYECRFPGATKRERFKTSPRRAPRLACISDFHGSAGGFDAEAATMGGHFATAGFDVLIVNGDHLTNGGAIRQSTSEDWLLYLEMITTLYRSADDTLPPMVGMTGNHEGESVDGSMSNASYGGDGILGVIKEIFTWGYEPDQPTRYANSAATFSIGTEICVIGIETDHTVPLPGAQTEWLVARVAEAYEKYRQIMIVGHAPAFFPAPDSIHFHDTQARHLRNIVYPLLAPYADKITCFMTGHSHVMADTGRVQMDYDDQLSLEDNDSRWFRDSLQGVRQLGCGPIQDEFLKRISRADHTSSVDSSAMLVAGIGMDPDTGNFITSFGDAFTVPNKMAHGWLVAVDGDKFTASAIGEDGGELLYEFTETLPAYQE